MPTGFAEDLCPRKLVLVVVDSFGEPPGYLVKARGMPDGPDEPGHDVERVGRAMTFKRWPGIEGMA
jgi:hypothetical protein